MKQKINLRLGLIALVALILTTVGVTKVYYDLFRQLQDLRSYRTADQMVPDKQPFPDFP